MKNIINNCPCGRRHIRVDASTITTLDRKGLETITRRLITTDAEHVSVISRLRAAIEQHRLDIWGDDGPIDHESDLALYAVLTDDDLEKNYHLAARKVVSGF